MEPLSYRHRIFENPQAFKTKQKKLLASILTFKSSPRHISTAPLNALRRLHSRPINLIVFEVSYGIAAERSHLGGGFTLRCFQRLSLPDVATQLYPWRDNWYTIGPSTPVLSY